MAYLIVEDFYKTYTESAFKLLINDAADAVQPSVWKDAASIAVDEAAGYLRARYDTDKIFLDITEHDDSETYVEAQRVYAVESSKNVVYYALQAVPASTDLTDTDYWRQGVSKTTQIVVDIALYHLLSRLNNHDIPVLRKERYDGNSDKQIGGALGWLKTVHAGKNDPNLPLREAGQEDQTGNIINYDVPDAVDNSTTF